MRIPSGVTDQYIYFVAVDATDLVTRETGLATWTVYRSRNGAASAAFTTPTINETDVTNMPGVYELLLDEDMTIDSGDDSQAVVLHITHAGMAPVTLAYELYRAGAAVTTSDIHSLLTLVRSDTTTLASDLLEGDFSDILSRLTVTNSDAARIESKVVQIYSDTTIIYSDTTTIQSDTTTLASDLAEADFSDIHSRLTLVLSDTSDVVSRLTVVFGAAGVISDMASKVTRIHSDTITLASDLAEGDFSDILSMLTVVRDNVSDIQSDTNVLLTRVGEGDWSDILSRLVVTNSQLVVVKSDVAHIESDAVVIETVTSDIQSDTNVIRSEMVEADTSDIMSLLTLVRSDTAHIESNAVRILSDTTAVHTQTTQINSDVISQFVVLEENTSDTESMLVKVYSDTTAIEGAGGGLSVAQDSKLTAVHSDTTKIDTKTAGLTYTVANQVDVNIESVNGTQVDGAGTDLDPWGPV